VAINADSLAKMKLDELKALATESGVKGVSRMRKGELVEALTGNAGRSHAETEHSSAPAPKPAVPEPVAAKPVVTEPVAKAPARKPRRAERPTGEAVGRPARHADGEVVETIIAINLDELADAEPRRPESGERHDPERQARLAELSNAVAEVGTNRERNIRRPRNDRYENAGRSENAARGDIEPSERTERYDRSEQAERDERQERNPRPGGRNREDGERRYENRNERYSQGERTERSDRTERVERANQGDRYERGERNDRQNQGERIERGERQDRTERTERADRPQRTDRLERTERPDRTERNENRVARESGEAGEDRNRNRQRDRLRDREQNRNKRRAENDEPEISEDDVLLPIAGILDVLDNYAFVRVDGYLPGPKDVYVSLNQVKRNGLRRGDAIIGAIKQPVEGEFSANARNKFPALVRVDSVNGKTVEEAKHRPEFAKLTPLYPQERLRLETTGGANKLSSRIIDIIAPIGKGQRGLLVSPPKAGKTLMMQQIANSITTNNPEVHLMVVLVDERPEEVTDFQRSVKGEVIASTFDRHASDHTTVAELAIERAKRLVELGEDVVILLDGITRLSRAYNLAAPASGRILSGGVDAAALYPPKKFFGAARNIEGGGSLTIIATALVETGSKMDEVIFEEFKGTGNMELRLSRGLAEKRIYPAINVNASSTRREEILLSKEELAIVYKLRRLLGALDEQQATELLLNQLKKTGTNLEFLMQVQKTTPNALVESELE